MSPQEQLPILRRRSALLLLRLLIAPKTTRAGLIKRTRVLNDQIRMCTLVAERNTINNLVDL